MKRMRIFDDIPELAICDTPYFSDWEVGCKCGCGQAIVQPKLVYLLHWARDRAGIRFTINSWNRCIKHNGTIGGVANSSHILGWAVDVRVYADTIRYSIIESLLNVGFPIIKVYPFSIHVSIDPRKHWGVFML